MTRSPLLLFILVLLSCEVFSQKQVVVIRKQDVMLRLYPGDEFVVRLKGSKRIKRSYVNNILDYGVVTHRDTVYYNEIDRIYFRHDTRMNMYGGLLVGGGLLLLVVDQVNNSVVQGNEVNFDKGFTLATGGAVLAGIPMMLIKKKSERLGGKSRIMTVAKGSIFYRPDTRNAISPYLDNGDTP